MIKVIISCFCGQKIEEFVKGSKIICSNCKRIYTRTFNAKTESYEYDLERNNDR